MEHRFFLHQQISTQETELQRLGVFGDQSYETKWTKLKDLLNFKEL
jgi:hypothetical protein